jgi:hypothetical protein
MHLSLQKWASNPCKTKETKKMLPRLKKYGRKVYNSYSLPFARQGKPTILAKI